MPCCSLYSDRETGISVTSSYEILYKNPLCVVVHCTVTEKLELVLQVLFK